MSWTLESAVALCKLIHPIAERHGCYPALTGGCLYREGERKDCDILFYRNRQRGFVDYKSMLEDLEDEICLIRLTHREQWCIKAKFSGNGVDLFFPEGWGVHEASDDYENPPQG